MRADVIKQTRSRQPSLCEDSDDERLGVSKRTRSKSEDDPNDGTTGTKLYPTGILHLKDRAGVRGILASPLSVGSVKGVSAVLVGLQSSLCSYYFYF